MKIIKKFLLLYAVFILLFSFTGCDKQDEKIEFDDTYPLALSPSVEWAVVKEPYAAYKSKPGWTSSVVGHCRRGQILQVKGRSVDSDNENWCYFDEGWLAESCLNIYSNRLKAERVSELLLQAE